MQRNIDDHWKRSYWQKEAGNRAPVAPSDPAGGRDLNHVLHQVARGLLQELATLGPDQRQLRVFRTMSLLEANEILEWLGRGRLAGTEAWIQQHGGQAGLAPQFHAAAGEDESQVGTMPISGHLGGMDQSYSYYKTHHDAYYLQTPGNGRRDPAGRPDVRVLEFTLKPGAHRLLFSPRFMALTGAAGSAERTPGALRKIYGHKAPPEHFQTAPAAEGNLPGYVGMKLESRADFSLAVGNDTAVTQLLFQLFVQDVRDVTKRASDRWNSETTHY
ncbi:hypothetical protein Afil01_33020 [Actinorhabdospora filicis]|uniref:Uncharacterized protein n=1 Tax=Actinorhabdospora filicis TaxID=1785913 RepID=A0A9W6SM95_9ACTN|nr:hypothetical protein [Actinorhabdospora filicis]GLZ78495.1 hypothetical protein Afil01_33020 [Actinorhabdospora filicis]